MAGNTVGHPIPERPGQRPGAASGPAARRAPGKLRWALAALLLLPVVELIVAIEVGMAIGALATLGLLVLGTVAGCLIVRREGSAAWRSLNSSLRSGTPPTRDLADATVLMLAGVMFIVPGFVTDVVALLLLLPFTRPIARRPLERAFRRAAADQAGLRAAYVRGARSGPPAAGGSTRMPGPGLARHDVVEGEVVDGERD